MKVTIWVDWDNQTICTGREELAEEFEDSDTCPEFEPWLNDHYDASEVWDVDADVQTAIKQEYQEYYDTCLTSFINNYFEAVQIEV